MESGFGPLSKVTLFELDVLGSLAQHSSLRSLSRSKKLKPPHLSKVLARLEDKLKSTLIQRSATGYILTPDGARLVLQARAVLTAAEELLEATPKEKNETPKLISFAASRFMATEVMAPRLEALRLSGVANRFRLLDMAPEELVPAALKNACDVLLTIGEPVLSRAWEKTKIGDLSWGLFCSSQHPLNGRVTEAKLKPYPFLVPTYWAGDSFELGEDHCPLPWKRRIRGDESSSVVIAVHILSQSSDLLLFAPRVVMQPYRGKRGIRELKVREWPSVSKPVYLSVRADKVSKRVHNLLVGVFGEALSQ